MAVFPHGIGPVRCRQSNMVIYASLPFSAILVIIDCSGSIIT